MIKVENISKKFIKEIKNKEKIEFYADKDILFLISNSLSL